MNTIEIQQAIIDNDWNKIIEVDWKSMFDVLSQDNTVINNEFITEFLMLPNSKIVRTLLRNKPELLISQIIKNNIHLSYHDYENILASVTESTRNALYMANLLLPTADKDQEFLRFFIDNFRAIEIAVFDAYTTLPAAVRITKNLLGDGSLNEQFIDVLITSESIFRYVNLDADENGLELLDSINRDILLTIISKSQVVSDDILNIAVDKYTQVELVETLIRNNASYIDRVLSKLPQIEYKLTDAALSILLNNKNNGAILSQVIVPLITKEQFVENKDAFGVSSAVNDTELELSEVAEIFPGKRASANKKFYTEEEIMKYPQFFSPGSVALSKLYYTKQTLTIINREFGRRARYNADSSDVTKIMILNIERLTPTIIRYLESKGDVDWNAFYDALRYSVFGEDATKQSELYIVSRIIEKYKN